MMLQNVKVTNFFGIYKNEILHCVFVANKLNYLILMISMNEIILKIVISLPVFLIAIVGHEFSHAYIAYRSGDSTAKDYGRMTFNPIPHIDVLGTIIIPLVGAALGGVIFGWAKPVPVDQRRFKNFRKGMFWVSFAGPIFNISFAIISAFLLACMLAFAPQDFVFFQPFVLMLQQSVFINILLAVFNLLPIPPLDGSQMVASFLDFQTMYKYMSLQRYSFMFFLLLMFTNVFSIIVSPFFTFGQGLISVFYGLLV